MSSLLFQPTLAPNRLARAFMAVPYARAEHTASCVPDNLPTAPDETYAKLRHQQEKDSPPPRPPRPRPTHIMMANNTRPSAKTQSNQKKRQPLLCGCLLFSGDPARGRYALPIGSALFISRSFPLQPRRVGWIHRVLPRAAELRLFDASFSAIMLGQSSRTL